MNKTFNQFAKRFLRDVAPKMRDSAYIMNIAPGRGTEDIKLAVEIGYAILLDKPLIVLKPHGRVVSPKLLRIADKVIEVDMNNPAAMERAQEELRHFMEQ